jgi:1-acyl-sn-glycerol-3-phosphate acyltransferase
VDTWHYEPASDLEDPVIDRLKRFPREPDMLVYGLRIAAAAACRGWLRLYHRLSIIGRENLPADGSFVMVANHASHLDALCLLAALPFSRLHRSFPAAAQDYFFVNAPRVLLAAIVVNALPFDRRTSARQSLSLCRQLLDKPGNALLLFPEGTRSPSGALGDFKPGIGLLLAGTNHPVLPCYLDGTHRAWPKGTWFPRPRTIRVHVGRPRTYAHIHRGKGSAEQIALDLREAVSALAGNPDHYITPRIDPESQDGFANSQSSSTI